MPCHLFVLRHKGKDQMKAIKYAYILAGVFSFLQARSSDTLYVNFRQADSIFLANNYYLLASSMNIEAGKARVIQARLYPNPVFTADLNVYDPENQRVFHVGSSGQKFFQLEQLILLGGKRKAEIDLAKTDVEIAELEFQNLLRQLKYKLHTELMEIGQQQVLLNKYDAQLALLDTIITAYEIQVSKGNIPLKDFVRLKGMYLNLNNDRAELLKEYFSSQADVQILLQTQHIVVFRFSDEELKDYIKVKSLDELKAEALNHHPDLQIMRQNKNYADKYLKLQKRMAVPDINIFTSYDQRSGAFTNQVNVGISMPLPLWNHNQGNIREAKWKIRETGYLSEAMQQEVLSNLQNHFALYTQTVVEYQKATRLYNEDFDITFKGMSENFQKRNVSLIEFVDFFESYNLVLAELARMKTQLVSSAELLNLSIGKDVY